MKRIPKKSAWQICVVSFFLLFAVVLVSCDVSKNVKSDSAPLQELTWFRFSDSVPPLVEQDPGTRLSYTLGPDRIFYGTYELGNDKSAKTEYVITMYLDNVMTPFVVGGVKHDSQKFKLNKKQTRWVQFSIGPIPEGTHDLAAAIFAQSDNHSTDSSYRLLTLEELFISGRINLISPGLNEKNTPAIAPDENADYVVERTSVPKEVGDTATRISTSKAQDDLRPWAQESLPSGGKLEYYVSLSNNTETSKTFALIQTLDYSQVPIGDEQLQYIPVTVQPKQRAILRLSIDLSKHKGLHELCVLAAANPYTLLSEKTFNDSLFLHSIRTRIYVGKEGKTKPTKP